MTTLPFVPEQPDSEQVSAVFDRLRHRWQGAPVLHLYRLLGWSPGLIGPWLDFSSALRFRLTISPALRELMIVRSGQLLAAEYEWKHHWVIAKEEGVSEEKLQALAHWQTNALFDADERAVLALADDTAAGTGASKATMLQLAERFSNEHVTEFVVTASFYAGVARIVNSFDVPLEPGFESMTPRDD
ncbi:MULTISPECIES: carboxymuconolactone decarboxylase family protein [Comamonadaceae]|uniref:carboxymuconolactone decarboxylase family protein n=1 Tax=Comamonadaceae TaxID=80864 RepID=UPI0010F733AD|nr:MULTISPECIES: carboxymuconolactone decarboxylase family protein [Comamonadaceae]